MGQNRKMAAPDCTAADVTIPVKLHIYAFKEQPPSEHPVAVAAQPPKAVSLSS